MNLTQQLAICSLIISVLHAADDARILTPYKTWKAHDGNIERMVAGSGKKLVTAAYNEQFLLWSKEGDCCGPVNRSKSSGSVCLAIDDKKRFLCISDDANDIAIFELDPHSGRVAQQESLIVHDIGRPPVLALKNEDDHMILYAGYDTGNLSKWIIDVIKRKADLLYYGQIALRSRPIRDVCTDETSLYIATNDYVQLKRLIGGCCKPVIQENAWALAQDNAHLYVGRANGNIDVYKKNTFESNSKPLVRIKSLESHGELIQSLLCQQDRLYASSTNAVSVWDTKTLALLGSSRFLNGHDYYTPIAVIENMLYRGLKTGEVIAYDLAQLQADGEKDPKTVCEGEASSD